MQKTTTFESLLEETLEVNQPINEASYRIIPRFKADPKTKKIAETLERG